MPKWIDPYTGEVRGRIGEPALPEPRKVEELTENEAAFTKGVQDGEKLKWLVTELNNLFGLKVAIGMNQFTIDIEVVSPTGLVIGETNYTPSGYGQSELGEVILGRMTGAFLQSDVNAEVAKIRNRFYDKFGMSD